ncbi:nucleus-vacuole junction protein Nvj2 [Schizosaccharomyces osmophilus]|uniref:Nucleus-vacuole junction protein Nvj2 n=1 Tax=Schizosaccharomyces osmophilus TaxID=2545709 RepID=A0AAF0AU75_9SCHI|nr:nucleus-vacuole junction protein Nvj2 [Schizosaccharomyces osmophilus]WBW72166.1 nucleus-vacuole junction protein Nvj2 [Schizosaccharomyces osmophilus]
MSKGKTDDDKAEISIEDYKTTISDSPETVVIQDWVRLSPAFLNGKSGSVKVQEIEETSDGKIESNTLLSDIKVSTDEGKTTRYAIKNPKNVYFVKLINGKLLLHDPLNTHCLLSTMVLENYNITLYPTEVSENEAFSNRNAILLEPTTGKLLPQLDQITLDSQNLYLYARTPSKKEDWYFKLLSFSKSCPPLRPIDGPVTFDYDTVKNNLDNLSSPDLIWLNAFIGRIYLGIHKSEGFKNTIKHKLSRKLSKISTPEMMSEIQVTNVDVGESVPVVNNLDLISFSEAGELNVAADILYQGDCSFKAETSAKLTLGSKIPSKKVKFSLVIRLRHLSGRVRLFIKPPPSNRIWYGFYNEPKVELHVEPTVFQKQLSNSYLLNFIRNKLLDLIFETMVLPHMNDIAFFSDDPFPVKGGLYNSKDSKYYDTEKQAETKKSKKPDQSPEPQLDDADWKSIKSSESIVKDFDLNKSLTKDFGNDLDNSLSDGETKSVQLPTPFPVNTNPSYALRDNQSVKSTPADRKSTKSGKSRPKFWNDNSQSTISDATKKYGVAAKKSFYQGISEAKSMVKKLQANYLNSSDDEDEDMNTESHADNSTSRKAIIQPKEKEIPTKSPNLIDNDKKDDFLETNQLTDDKLSFANKNSQFKLLQKSDSGPSPKEETKRQPEGQENTLPFVNESMADDKLLAKEKESNTDESTLIAGKHKLPRRPLPYDVSNENNK